MQALMQITTNSKGEQTVNASVLHSFLEVKTRLDNWTNRMIEYGFVEGVDYQRVYKVGQTINGKPKNVFEDCILTLDTAKHISMIQRTEKGMQARQYFIECEKKLTQVKQVVQPAIAKLQQELARKDQQIDGLQHLLRIQENRANDARQMVEIVSKQGERWYEHYKQTQDNSNFYRDLYKQEAEMCRELRKKLTDVAPQADQAHAQVELPAISTGTRINRLVRQFAADNADKISFEETWNWLYREFRDRYHIDPLRFVLKKHETRIGRINEMGMLEQLLAVAESLFLKAQAA